MTLAYYSAAELLNGYRDGSISPVEATKAAFTQISAHNGKVNAFCHLNEEQALHHAALSEARWREGKPCGMLDGVPTSIKDLALTKGMPSRSGSRTSNPDGPWNVDAPFVARLKEHGAILLGKTTTPEYGWKGVTDSPLTGITRNPWDLEKTPGGSSGGAAAALVAGMGPLATGSDGGGSIRIPAGFTGLFGIKMNFGRIPVYPESAMRSLSHAGPMARNVRDGAIMATVMSEPDHRDWTALPYQRTDWSDHLDKGVNGLKIGLSMNLGYADVDAQVVKAVEKAASVFAELGAVVELCDPGFEDPIDAFEKHWFAGAAGLLGHLDAGEKAKLDPGLAEVIEEGKRIQITDYTEAMAARTRLCLSMREYHQKYDLLLTPALAVLPFSAGQLTPSGDDDKWTSWTPFTYPFNLTQQPAGVICCGVSEERLPIGLQLVSGSFREDLVFAAASAYEQARGELLWPEIL